VNPIAIITGSGGLIGSESVRHFASLGFDVVGIENDMRARFFGPDASTSRMSEHLVRTLADFRHEQLDVRDADGVVRLFERIGRELVAVVHTAAQPSHDWAASDPHTDFGVNAQGTLNLLQATREHCPDASFVFTSTNKVYGDRPNFLPLEDRGARLEVALLHPVAHRTTLRAVLTTGKHPPVVEPRSVAGPDDVARGWARQLDRGLRVELPSDALMARTRAARAEVLLAGQTRAPGAAVFAALEDWGFDAETAVAWRRLGVRDRQVVRTRAAPGSWADAEAIADDADFLVAVRRLLVDDGPKRPIDLLAHWPTAWRGEPLAVHGAPIPGGTVSYAVRWHGPRAAFLWETTASDVTLRVPSLDPEWSTTEARGEALLGVTEPTA